MLFEIISFLVPLVTAIGCVSGTGEYFLMANLCDVDERIQQNCMVNVASRSAMDCAMQCGRSDNCTGYSVDVAGSCNLLSQCVYIVGCKTPYEEHTYYTKRSKSNPCQNNGTWHEESDTCVCVSGFVGNKCHLYPRKCPDLILQGYEPDTYYDVLMLPENAVEPFVTRCTSFGTKTRLDLFRRLVQLKPVWNNTWSEYENGFYGWQGLKNMRALMETCDYPDCLLRLVYGFRGNTEPNLRISYIDARLSDKSTGYKLSYQNRAIYTNPPSMYVDWDNMNACLQQNTSFSTYDSDNDGDASKNCASITGNGWWYPNCTDFCNPLGQFYTYGDPESYGDEFIRIPGIDMRNMTLELSSVALFLLYE